MRIQAQKVGQANCRQDQVLTSSKLEIQLGLELKSLDFQPSAYSVTPICCIFHLLLKDGTVKIERRLWGGHGVKSANGYSGRCHPNGRRVSCWLSLGRLSSGVPFHRHPLQWPLLSLLVTYSHGLHNFSSTKILQGKAFAPSLLGTRMWCRRTTEKDYEATLLKSSQKKEPERVFRAGFSSQSLPISTPFKLSLQTLFIRQVEWELVSCLKLGHAYGDNTF